MSAHLKTSEIANLKSQTAPLVVVCLTCRQAAIRSEHLVPVNEHGWAHVSHGYCPPCGAAKLAEVHAQPVPKEAA
jgi:hypothetical protein